MVHLLQPRDGVAEVVLAGEGAAGALTLGDVRRLRAVARALEAAPGVRAVLLRSEGAAFCVGGDVRELGAAPDREAHVAAMVEPLHDAVLTLHALRAPLVTAVQGAAAGAGLGLAALGDLVFAGPRARFAWAYATIGLSADAGCSWLLPRLIGLRLTQAMALGARVLDADAALAAGLVTAVVDEDALLDAARSAAFRLATGPVAALSATRTLLEDGRMATLEAHLGAEGRSVAALAGGLECREGVSAFLSRRPPRFSDIVQ